MKRTRTHYSSVLSARLHRYGLRLACLLAYVSLGVLGIEMASLAGGNLTLFWLPAGVSAFLLCRLGPRALPWVLAGTYLVNTPYLWRNSYDLWQFLQALPSPLFDALEPWLVWRLWGRRYASERCRDGLGIARMALLAACLPALIASFGMSAMQSAAGLLPAPSEPAFWQGWLQIALADAQGIFLLLPLLLLSTRARLQALWKPRLNRLLLVLLPLLVLLGTLQPVLAISSLPAMSLLVSRDRQQAAILAIPLLVISCAIATTFGLGPLAGLAGNEAYSMLAILTLCIGAPAMLMGCTLDALEESRARLEERVHERTAELENLLAETERLASTDRLTGCWNRRHFEETAYIEMARALRHGQSLSLLLVDLDHFKQINDTHGHQAGDRVLVNVVQCIRERLRASDAITRWGGEEFLILAPHTGLAAAGQLAEGLCLAIYNQRIPGIGRVSLSIGVASYLPGEQLDDWLRRTDQAMYRAKAMGRNQVVVAWFC